MTEGNKGRSNFNPGIFTGGIILIIGTVFLLDNLGIIKWDFPIWDFWPVIIILIGLSKLFYPHSRRISFLSLFMIGLGVLLLLDQLGKLSFEIGDLWPLVIIVIGFNIIRHHTSGHAIRSKCLDKVKNRHSATSAGIDKDFLNISSILGGGEYKFNNKNLKGGKLTAIMGGGEIDLRECSMEASYIEINVFILMGGYKLIIPPDWNTIIQASPLLGGIEHKTNNIEDPKKEIVITGTIIMGGLELKN
jgi:hypothetical protein